MLDANKVKEQLTNDDIICLCHSLQNDDTNMFDPQGHPIFNTCLDHEGGDSYKLYYFNETKLFHVFTRGESYDVFELVKRAKHLNEFIDAYRFVINFFKLKDNTEEQQEVPLIDDWDIFTQIDDFSLKCEEDNTVPTINENLLEYYYPLAAPTEWLKENITSDVMRYYGIRIDTALHKVIIPHRNIDGNLIGIRGRSYNPIEIDEGKKYMPVSIEGTIMRHPLGKNLFGLYENKEAIMKLKKVLIVEAEKSVLQCASYYGVDNCFCLATCGSSLSQAQIELIMKLGVTEVILGYDKEFNGGRGDSDTVEYEKKLLKTIQPLSQYFNTYVIIDYDGLLDYKDSPTDKGKETLEKLMKNKIYIPPISLGQLRKERKK